MTRKEKLIRMLDYLLENVEDTTAIIINEFEEDERDDEEIKLYLKALLNIRGIISYYIWLFRI